MGTKSIDKQTIFAALRFLEQSGSVKETAERYKVSRVTIFNWNNRHSKEYSKHREELINVSQTVEAQKIRLNGGSDKLIKKNTQLFEKIVDYFIDDEEAFKKLSGKDKVGLLNTILPYVLEKKGIMPVNPKDPTGNNTQNNIFLNIIEQMKNGDEEDKIRRSIEAITVSPDS